MSERVLRDIARLSVVEGEFTVAEALDESVEKWRSERAWDLRRTTAMSDTTDYTEAPSYSTPWDSDYDSDDCEAI